MFFLTNHSHEDHHLLLKNIFHNYLKILLNFQQNQNLKEIKVNYYFKVLEDLYEDKYNNLRGALLENVSLILLYYFFKY